MQMKHILGTVTVIAIVGGTIYAIKKSKDLEKSEEQEITLAEAKEIVKEREFNKAYSEQFEKEPEHFGEDFEEALDDAREMAEHNRSFMPPNYDEEEDEEYIDETVEGPGIDDNDIGTFTEEDRILRYEPSSMDALKQYKRMEIADLAHNGEVYQTMIRLFDFPFQPTNDGDDLLRTQIIDYRVQFFGFGSRWAQQVTFADVILHYARAANFNCDETVAYWVEYFLDYNDLYYAFSANAIDAAINTLNAHQYYNDERQTFGLFGLTRNSMDQAIAIANRNIDRSVTYEIEFQEFLKSCF
jgi:HSP20 family molecular chaperone IbpA